MPVREVDTRLARRINLVCLVGAIFALCVFPQRKQIWYDETVSMLISKGIGHDAPGHFAHTDTISSGALQELNTPAHVYRATIKDLGNSLTYNLALHWLTRVLGNEISIYTLLSKVSAVATLLVFYGVATLLFNGSLFTSLAIILLATDATFVLLSHEIRAYSMATLLIVLAGLYFYKFMYATRRPRDLFLTGLFSAIAVLTHFFTAYVILVLAGYIVVAAGRRILSVKMLTAIAVPTLAVAAYLYFAIPALLSMRVENQAVRGRMDAPLVLSEVLYRSAGLFVSDFRMMVPSFRNSAPLVVFSLALIVVLYAGAVRVATDRDQKQRLHMLFVLGVSGTVFFALVSVAAGHYSFLYHRYHAFGIPFACLFTAYALATLVRSPRIPRLAKIGALSAVFIPSIAFYASLIKNYRPTPRYSHVGVAKEIAKDGIAEVVVPEWNDALVLHTLLPSGHAVRYVRNVHASHFTLRAPGGESRVRARVRL